MPPIEKASEFMRDIGAEELGEYISKTAKVLVSGRTILKAFQPPIVEKEPELPKIVGLARPILEAWTSRTWATVVTHEYEPKDPKEAMMNWIPQIKESPPSYANPEGSILKAFGISYLENFRQEAQTRMVLSSIHGEWVFEGYDKSKDRGFNRLKETLWAITMLPTPVIEEALESQRFFLVSERIGKSGQTISAPTIASIAGGAWGILVEDFSGLLERGHYKIPGKEDKTRDIPVVLLRYY